MVNKNFYILIFKVKPNKKKTEIIKKEDDVYHIDLAAQPVDNQANEELVKFVAKEFGVQRSKITFLSGKSSKIKRLKICRD